MIEKVIKKGKVYFTYDNEDQKTQPEKFMFVLLVGIYDATTRAIEQKLAFVRDYKYKNPIKPNPEQMDFLREVKSNGKVYRIVDRFKDIRSCDNGIYTYDEYVAANDKLFAE